MADLLRETPLGQMIRYLTRNRLLPYPEERPDFQLPKWYAHSNATTPLESPDAVDLEKSITHGAALERSNTRPELEKITTRHDLERAYTAATQKSTRKESIIPDKLDDGTIVVTWYDTDDPANPQNWSTRRKCFVTVQICLYTLAVYVGSAIYTPSTEGVMHRFGVSITASSLGLALYVLAYGIGPLIFSPLSEIPSIGRNPPYIATFAIFVILCVPTALADNFAGLMVLRFLQGFFGSPCLATGGASLQDMFSLIKIPYAIACWALFATCGPALGPIISGFSVPAKDWRWSLWEILWIAAPTFILLFVALPETSAPNLLLRRARRLRKLTGDNRYKSQSEIDQASFSVKHTVIDALWKPLQIMFLDPSIAFADVYIALCYGIFYSFFEVFPLVFINMYGFNLGLMGLTFLTVSIGVVISLSIYIWYLYYIVEPGIRAKGLGAPESRLIPGLVASICLPIGLFIFGWTARESIHWVVCLIGVTLFCAGLFILFQSIFSWLPLSYPAYAASLFAGNDFLRSALAAGAILFARPLFINLGVARGVSLLGGLTAGCIFGIFALYIFGARLRAKSRFTAK